MAMPILIILERHWDKIPKEILELALDRLIEKGYDTICFETPPDDNKNIILNQESTVQYIDEYYQKSLELLNNRNIPCSNMVDMNFLDLQKLLKHYVSSQKYTEIATWIKELPGHQEKLLLMKQARIKKMELLGIDLNSKELEPLIRFETQWSIQEKIKSIDLLDDDRINAFYINLKKLQKSGNNTVFVVGQVHYEKLVRKFYEDSMLDDVIFLHPHANKNFDNSYNDKDLLLFSSKREIPKCSIIDKPIITKKDRDNFINLMIDEINEKVLFHKKIEKTQSISLLNKATNMNFIGIQRNSLYVDAYAFSDEKNTRNDSEVLEKMGYRPKIRFFDNKKAICISNINEDKCIEYYN